jgi:hypothetical protein
MRPATAELSHGTPTAGAAHGLILTCVNDESRAGPSVTSPFNVLSQLEPLSRHPQPRLFVEWTDRPLGRLAAIFRLSVEPSDVLVGHLLEIAVVVCQSTLIWF